MRGLTRRKGGGEGVLLVWVLAAGVTANAPAYKVGAQGIEAECRTGLRCATHFKSVILVYIHSPYNAHLQATLTYKPQPPASISLRQRWAVR